MVLNSFRSTHLLPILTKLLKMRQEILPHPFQVDSNPNKVMSRQNMAMSCTILRVETPNQSTAEHQVGVTNAQENNPDPILAQLTRQMNAEFQAGKYREAGTIALEITARNKDELAAVFQQHRVTVLHLDHEAFGIYEGQIEPTYDIHVDGRTDDVLAASSEFGKRHAQEMVLIARKFREGESDPDERMGLTITLHASVPIDEAVIIAELVRTYGFKGATFAPKREGEVAIYHTDNLGMSGHQFLAAASALIEELKRYYSQLTFGIQKFIIQMPRL